LPAVTGSLIVDEPTLEDVRLLGRGVFMIW
jgi:hypothetical protein